MNDLELQLMDCSSCLGIVFFALVGASDKSHKFEYYIKKQL